MNPPAAQPNYKPWSARLSLLGALLAVPAIAVLLALAVPSVVHVVSFSLYGVGLLSMLVASGVYHSCPGPQSRVLVLRKFDYGAIALMVAGNFTPFCLLTNPGFLGCFVLAAVWGLAFWSLHMITRSRDLPIWGLITLFLAMGWLGIFVVLQVLRFIGWGGFGLLFLGGVVYTVGTLLFNGDERKYKPRPFGAHEIWHVMILVAAGIHYYVCCAYLLP